MRAAEAQETTARTPAAKHPSSVAGLTLPDELLEHVAALVAQHVIVAMGVQQEPYLDREAAQVYLACNKDRIYDLVRLKRLRHFKDGSRLLFRRSDLDDCLEVFDRV